MKIVRGYYWPDNELTGWIEKIPLNDGNLLYSSRIIDIAIRNCGSRLRTAVDGGAHVGLIARQLAPRFRQVVAFEPNHEAAECLKANCLGYQNVALQQMALSDSCGVGTLTGSPKKSVGWSMSTYCAGSIERTVPTVTLDSMNLKKVDFIKLDVEGLEYEALRGARRTILKYRPVVLIEEKHDHAMRATGFLCGLGMQCVASKKNDYLFVWGP